MEEDKVKCPKCGALNPIYIKRLDSFICRKEDCEHEFEKKSTFKKIFISYGHDKCKDLAFRLKDNLEKVGHNPWIDKSKLKLGEDWEVAIENGLRESQIIIVLMTPYSVGRPIGLCLNELSMATILNLTIVPIMVRDVMLPLSIVRIPWLDFREWPCSEAIFNKKFNQILRIINNVDLEFGGKQIDLKNRLRPVDFGFEIEYHSKNFIGRQQLFVMIKNWLYNSEDKDSKIFLLTGKPGTGKTAVAAMLCHTFPEVAGYFLVSHNNLRKSDAIEFVLSIAYQLSTQILDYAERLGKIDLEGIREKEVGIIFRKLIIQPLNEIKSPSKPVLIVIDALDEARRGEKNDILYLLTDYFNLTPPWLKLFITSRQVQDVLKSFASLEVFSVDIDNYRNILDIKRYLEVNLKEMFPTKKIKKAMEIILENSRGVFLYVQEIINELKLGRINFNQLEDLPKGLTQVYVRFFNAQFPIPMDYDKHQRPLLELIVAAREPLEVNLIREILGWDNYSERKSINPLESMLEIVEGYVRPFHLSLIHWLTDPKSSNFYFIDKEKGIRRLFEHNLSQIQLVPLMPKKPSIKTDQKKKLKIFFSYVEEDSEFFKIKDIAKMLENNHFIRYYERDLKPGDSIIRFMRDSVIWCDVLIWFFTPKVMKSASLKEFEMASMEEKKIIPVTDNFKNLPPDAKIYWAAIYKNDVTELSNEITNGLEKYVETHVHSY